MKGEMMTETNVENFIKYLTKLSDEGNRGVLAALRRGLGQRPGEAPGMFPYVVPFLPSSPNRDQENAYYLVASLFAFHPKNCSLGNLGNHLAACIENSDDKEAVERRFVILLSCHIDDLADTLRQSISYLKSKEEPVNYQQLLNDLLQWSYRGRIVQRRWATGFWGRNSEPTESDTKISVQ
jgi:CRISPR system Cascade subunit CasB